MDGTLLSTTTRRFGFFSSLSSMALSQHDEVLPAAGNGRVGPPPVEVGVVESIPRVVVVEHDVLELAALGLVHGQRVAEVDEEPKLLPVEGLVPRELAEGEQVFEDALLPELV